MAQWQALQAQAKNISPGILAAVLVGGWIIWQAITYLRDPLRDVPGPFWARFTRLWYLKEIAGGRFEKTNVQLHNKYGISPKPSALV
ncbi:hypothetical protein HRR83_006991 [Exophiala dermatitidis]|uniref:Uncharacterized protein n=1 Tax=Exophiala dermatitidis TaxID=5970 RepID=A0AAN6IT57_EXODE|nr:hypothetical protein HRR73_006030 [Exophiala dermatitidis]KAJ4512651.1 hypothetical protein HRR74_006349 [Exophiala dermatitidis]KAJ4542452.1 hypothetical protein HRR77_005653 [Exophiala dermatitidis]KAJ4548139.1 hypothetical protein HRR76_000750 [Exophiala dermatitidis]KAJ4568105.1 hypothetical protein HRR82_008011 [Exophiala dermatitidis]